MPYIGLAQSGLQVAFSPDQKNELKTGLVDVQAGKGWGWLSRERERSRVEVLLTFLGEGRSLFCLQI